MTLAANFEDFYFSLNFILIFLGNITKFGGNWLKNKKVTGKKQNTEWKTLLLQFKISGINNTIPHVINVEISFGIKENQDNKWIFGQLVIIYTIIFIHYSDFIYF